ncbi:MAG: DDE-type integrase/transposase/recombinase [Candidatus Parcubacteria bacterium]|nr:DDE-type integrase/transposase/recombinase [Candidatus Parcubacteria bacterium]
MSIHMVKTIKEEKLKWVLPIVKKEGRLIDVAKVCPHSKRSLERWLALYKKLGETGLEPRSTEPKTQEKETPIWIKERIIEIRKKTKKCALKIHWQLEKEGILIHERTIGKILKKEGLVRKYRVRKIKYKYIRALRQPGELMEIDVKYVPGKIANKRYFQYTAIDTASRWRHLNVYEEQTNFHSILFLKEVIDKFTHKIQAIKTDNGSIFTNYYTSMTKRSDMTVKTIHALDLFCRENNIIHYLIDPGKPAQNGTVERSHREDQEKFYEQNKFRNFSDLQKKMKRWNMYYNDLEHCGLNGKTPNEFLKDYQLIKPPYVCA